MKKSTSFRLSDEALNIIKRLSRKLGLSNAAVIELAVRKLEQKEKSDA